MTAQRRVRQKLSIHRTSNTRRYKGLRDEEGREAQSHRLSHQDIYQEPKTRVSRAASGDKDNSPSGFF